MIIITTTSLPNGVDGVAYSQAIATSGGVAPLTFTLDSGTLPTGLSLGAGTGIISGTPSATGTFNFVIEVEDDNTDVDTQAYTVSIYDPLVLSPEPEVGETAVYTSVGSQIHFSATGGSGNYVFSVDGGNIINPSTGLFTAVNGGSYTVAVTDLTSGQVTLVSIVVASQAQFCVTGAAVDAVAESGSICCEFNVECGNRLELKVPSFHIIENGHKVGIQYSNVVQAVTGDAAALQSRSAGAGANGNTVSFSRDAYFEIVTSFDMASVSGGEVAIGWSGVEVDTLPNSIKHAVIWYTDAGVRMLEVQHSGVVEAGSDFAILQGDVVSFGIINGSLQLWLNSVLVFTSAEDTSTCGNMFLDISITDNNTTVGGYVDNLNWSILTAGSPSQVGMIDANGFYTSPSNPIVGIISVVGSINNANFYVNIRNIQPTPVFTKAQPFIAGKRANIWVTDRKATDREIIRLASDGSPDALQNPNMIFLGTLEASATFAEEIEYQDFDDDEGTYQTSIGSEKAMLTGTFLEVRDLDKLAMLMNRHATLHATQKGVRELSVGGKTCDGCDLRAVLVVESGACGDGYDVIYMPRVQNTGNLNLEIGKKTNAKYELSLRVLPDKTLPRGKQLYSIYQMDNCSAETGSNSCEPGLVNLTPASGPIEESAPD